MPEGCGEGEVKRDLQRVPGRAHEIAQHGYVWLVGADSARIHRKAEPLGKFQIHARVIKLRKTEPLRGQHAIQPRRIHGPRRTMRSPRAARHFIELLPIAFVPSRHTFSLDVLSKSLDAAGVQKVHRGSFCASLKGASSRPELFIYISESPAKHFPRLLYQTRYGEICFECFQERPRTRPGTSPGKK